ncbi:MAG: serine hydrolase [Halieaceae bacterium]|nr:serine hydrolase [Halieaceae bacterium]
MRLVAPLLCALTIGVPLAHAEDYDYFGANRQMIRNGMQAVLTCNGLFTSKRSLDQVFAQELAYLTGKVVGTAKGGNYRVDTKLGYVNVGGGDDGVAIGAAFREGIGCVVMAPDMSEADIGSLPELVVPATSPAAASIPWPEGDLTGDIAPDADVSAQALSAAADWAFERDTDEQDTLSLLIVHRGKLVYERYADGVDMTTRTRTWSTAKSIVATLIGMQVDAGNLALDESLGETWLPALPHDAPDPRDAITLRHALNMSSGLYPIDSFNMEYATGSGLSYWAGASSEKDMRDRGLITQPGTFWDYENYDTLLAVGALKRALGSGQAYLDYPRMALFDKIGMHNTLASTDRFGDFIFSSQVYTNARDLARFGLLYLNQGKWQGEQLISEEWIEFSRTPAPASAVRGNDYGGQWWLVPDERKAEVPGDAYSTAGNRGQFVIVAPSHDLVIVRRGLDYGKQGFDRWDLLREVVKAFPPVTNPRS